jgi:hypothetical protein
MAIKRCPYCRSIIDERDQFCNNCGTQLLFPEDEFIEEEIPGEKPIDVGEKAEAEDVDLDLSLEEPEAASIARSATSLGFPDSLTSAEGSKKRGRKSKKAEAEEAAPEPSPDRVLKTSELPEMGTDLVEEQAAGKTSAAMRFDDVFSAKPAETKPPASKPPASKTQAPVPPKAPTDEASLSASAEEIEDIARMMSSLDGEPKDGTQEKDFVIEPAVPPVEKTRERGEPVGDTAFYQKKIEDIRRETLHGAGREKAGTGAGELRKSTTGVPPWATGLRVEPPAPEKSNLPGLVDTSKEDLRHETVSDILNKLEKDPLLQSGEEEPPVSNTQEEAFASPTDGRTDEEPPRKASWDEIPDRETPDLDSWSDRLGRERREAGFERPTPRRDAAAGGSRLKGKIYDVLLILMGWVLAVWLATKILSVSMTDIFNAAAVPLLLFLLTLAVAYFFLFLYFLGETLGDRLSS